MPTIEDTFIPTSGISHLDRANHTAFGNLTLIQQPDLCTLQTCDLTLSSFLYIPSLGGNAIFAGCFAVFFLAQIWIGIKHKTWGYMAAMFIGLFLEIIGYIARVMLHNSPFDRNYFLIYLVTLTIAPALLSAAVYLCLSRIVIVYGAHLSYFKPRTYTVVFASCDLVSLFLQAAGGGIAASANTESATNVGKNLMLVGLVFQVISLIVFTLAASWFAKRVWAGQGAWNPAYLDLVHSRLFRSFLIGLAVATITIFARSVYRCAELSGGFDGALFRSDQAVFMILEGLMVVTACFCLTALHPAISFQGFWHEANFKFRAKDQYANIVKGSQRDSEIELTSQAARPRY